MSFVSKNRVDGFVFGGDQMNNSEISHHTAGKSLFRPKGAFVRNEKNFDSQILRPLEAKLKDADRIWLQGNHDRWELDVAESQPELQGCFDRIVNLRLKERGWKIVENGKSTQLGKLTVCHGDTITGGSNLAARKAIEVYFKSVLFGHFHNASSFSKVSPVDSSLKYMAWSSPVLCKLNPAYLRNKPNSWVNGFTVVYVMPNGNFNVYPVIVAGGKFAFEGRVYGG